MYGYLRVALHINGTRAVEYLGRLLVGKGEGWLWVSWCPEKV